MGKINDVDEGQYKVDFEISKGFIDFSSELLRLSLLAMGGFGALALIKIENQDRINPTFLQNPLLFLLSMALFALCAGATLFHRYFASDSMSWYIGWLRAESSGNSEKAEREKRGFRRMLKLSGAALICSEVFFGGGVLVFFIAIIKLFYP